MPAPSQHPASLHALSYFPSPFPDELIYSLLARYAFDTQLSASAVNGRLFGKHLVHISYDVPTQLRALSNHIGGADADCLMQRHTLVPFFTALMSPAEQARVRTRVLNNEQVTRNLLSPHAIVPRPTHLRFCPECDLTNRERLGVAIWQRRHQLPTSVVCAVHRRPLLRSMSSTTPHRVRAYDPAGETGSGMPLVPNLPLRRLERFVVLAEEGYRLLEEGETVPGSENPPSLWQLAIDAGFATGGKVIKVDQQALIEEFEVHDPDVVRLWPWLGKDPRKKRLDWVQRHILRSGRNSATTFTYAVLKTFLARRRHGLSSAHAAGPPADWSEVAFEPRLIDASRTTRCRTEEELAEEARAAAREVMGRNPPVRVTYSQIIRQAPSLHQAIKSGRFPNLRQMIDQITEEVRTFQLRRVVWLIRQKRASGEEPTPTWVRQRSGIPDFGLVRQLVQEATEMIRNGSS